MVHESVKNPFWALSLVDSSNNYHVIKSSAKLNCYLKNRSLKCLPKIMKRPVAVEKPVSIGYPFYIFYICVRIGEMAVTYKVYGEV